MKYIIKYYVTVETLDIDSANELSDELANHILDFNDCAGDDRAVVSVSVDDPEVPDADE